MIYIYSQAHNLNSVFLNIYKFGFIRKGAGSMKLSRLRKFKSKNSRFLLFSKLVLIWYLILLSGVYFTSDTTAYFSESLQTNGGMSIGSWEKEEPNDEEEWDESELSFITKGNQNWDSCEALTIKAKIKNSGNGDMQAEGKYEVYYIEKGNPQKHGEKMKLDEEEGVIKALKSGEEIELTYKADLAGRYVFKAYQHSLNPNNKEIWSEKIKFDCGSGQDPNKQETEKEAGKDANPKQEETMKEEAVTESKETENNKGSENTSKDEKAAEEIKVNETKEKEPEKQEAAEEAEKKSAESKIEESKENKEQETQITKETNSKEAAAHKAETSNLKEEGEE